MKGSAIKCADGIRVFRVLYCRLINVSKVKNDEALTLANLSEFIGYSEYYVSRKFKEISGMQLRDYLRYRKLAFALKDIQNTESGYELDITSGRVFYFYHDCKRF